MSTLSSTPRGITHTTDTRRQINSTTQHKQEHKHHNTHRQHTNIPNRQENKKPNPGNHRRKPRGNHRTCGNHRRAVVETKIRRTSETMRVAHPFSSMSPMSSHVVPCRPSVVRRLSVSSGTSKLACWPPVGFLWASCKPPLDTIWRASPLGTVWRAMDANWGVPNTARTGELWKRRNTARTQHPWSNELRSLRQLLRKTRGREKQNLSAS